MLALTGSRTRDYQAHERVVIKILSQKNGRIWTPSEVNFWLFYAKSYTKSQEISMPTSPFTKNL